MFGFLWPSIYDGMRRSLISSSFASVNTPGGRAQGMPDRYITMRGDNAVMQPGVRAIAESAPLVNYTASDDVTGFRMGIVRDEDLR